METLDGYTLKEGDACWVSCQCAEGVHNISPSPRKAFYLDGLAKSRGLDFTLSYLRADCESIEILAVWKEKPTRAT